MSYLPLNPSIRSVTNPLQLKGGLAFDSTITGAKSLYVINSNIGTNNFTYYAEIQIPSTAPSGTIGLFQLGAVSSSHIDNSSFSIFINSSTIYFTLYGPSSTATFVQDSISNFVTNYAGQVISLAVVRNATTPSLTVYVNGIAVTTSSSSAGGITWGATVASTYCNIGSNGGSTYGNNVFASKLFTRALSQSDVLSLINNGVSDGDKWASLTAKYTSSFTSGTDSWTVNGASTVTRDAGPTGGQTDNLLLTSTVASESVYSALRVLPVAFVARKKYRVTYSYYMPVAANSQAKYFGVYAISSSQIIETVTPANLTWTTRTVEFTASSSSTSLAFYLMPDLFTTAYTSTSSTDSLYIRGITVTEIGCLLDADLANADPTLSLNVIDKSSNGYTGTVSSTGVTQVLKKSIQLYGDQTTANISNNTAISARNINGGLAFDGVTTTAKDLHTIGANIGTSDFSVTPTILVPSSNPSASIAIATISSTGVYGVNDSLLIFIDTSGGLNVRLYDALGGYVNVAMTTLVSSYGGKVVAIACVRNATTPSMTVYINGVAQTVTTSTSGAATWANTLTSTYLALGYGSSSILFNSTIYSAQLFTRALSVSEVVDLANKGVSEGDKWASLTATFGPTDFTAGTDSFTSGSGVTVARDASTSGRSDNLAITPSATTGTHYATRAGITASVGKRYRVVISYYIPAGNTAANTLNVVYGGTSATRQTTTGSWQDVSLEVTATSTTTLQIFCGNNTNDSFTGNGTDVIYVRAISIYRVGCLLDADLGVGIGYQVPDRSSNHYDGLISTSGVSHTVAKQSGQARFSLSADGYLGDTTSRACIPADSFIDSITAYSTGTPTFTIGDDSGSAANVIGSTTLSASTVTALGTSGVPLKRFLTTGTKGRVYVDFTAGAAATTFTINYSATGNY